MKKAYRVKKNRDIEAILHYRKGVHSTSFKVFKKPQNNGTHFRFAVSVPKKFGNAVKRNRIKRQIRSVIAQLPIAQGWDILIIVKPMAKELTYSSLEKELVICLTKQQLLEVKV